MVVSALPDASVCNATSSAAPSTLHRVWVGGRCPDVQELVSLLVASLILEPEAIHYYIDGWHPTARPHLQCRAAKESFWSCPRALNASLHFVNRLDNRSHFAGSVADFKARVAVGEWPWQQQYRAAHLSDIIRLWVLNQHGGIYLDSDVFVLSRSLLAFTRCPFTVASDLQDGPSDGELVKIVGAAGVVNDTKLAAANRVSTPAAMTNVNNGILVAKPNSTFGNWWWRRLERWPGLKWSTHSCVWPLEFERAHPEHLQVALSVRTFPFYRLNASMSWAGHVAALAARNVTAIHLTGTDRSVGKRGEQLLPVMRAALDHAIRAREARGVRLTPAQRTCLRTARQWMEVKERTGQLRREAVN